MTVAVIYGGRSGEHEISLISASAIVRGIDRKHSVLLIGINKAGRWFLQDGRECGRIRSDADAVLQVRESESAVISVVPGAGKSCFRTPEKQLSADVVFPALHGSYGEDGTIQGLLDMAGIAYVGCPTLPSALTMDKEKTKQIWRAAGLSVVPYVCMRRCDLTEPERCAEIRRNALETLGLPLFVKPCCAGSSNGASRASSEQELSAAITEAFRWDDKILIEKAVHAREIECSVTGNSVTAAADSAEETVRAYVPGEVISARGFYDYDSKYKDPDGARLDIPADLPADMIETIRATAVRAYKAVDAAGLSRVDFFIDKDSGALYLNEINTMPGFTSISMFPKMCAASGMAFSEITELLLHEAVARFRAKNLLQSSI